MKTQVAINLAVLQNHEYGWHRTEGAFPGIKLSSKLDEIVRSHLKDPAYVIAIDLGDMKTLYRSFADGVFGRFMDEFKDDFFERFKFISENKPRYVLTIKKLFDEHKRRGFNQDIGELQ